MSFQGNSQSSSNKKNYTVKPNGDIVTDTFIIGDVYRRVRVVDSLYHLFNDSVVTISKKTAQNILKSKDSADRLKAAYNALFTNYNRLKQKSSIQDTAYKYKEKEATICRELLKNQQSQTDMWSIQSHQQSKEIKKQKFLKWVFIVTGAAGIGWGITK